MSIWDAIILGIVQGATEFAPVSSSGHLVIVSHVLSTGNAFVFDVLLNIGTLLALIIFYRQRVWLIIKRLFDPNGWVLAFKIIAAVLPAIFIALIFDEQIEYLNGMIWVVIVTLIVVGLMMIFTGKEDVKSDNREIEKSVGWGTAMFIGVAQATALIPGVSRSGITILAGLRKNLTAARAAEFSFILAIPVLLGGIVKTLFSSEGRQFVSDNLSAVIIGNIFSFAVGYMVVSFLIGFISRRGLKDFGWYRIGLATLLVILLTIGVI